MKKMQTKRTKKTASKNICEDFFKLFDIHATAGSHQKVE